MARRNLLRLGITWYVVLALLWAPAALACRACPMAGDGSAPVAALHDGAPCHGTDVRHPSACHPVSADPAKTSGAQKLPGLSSPAIVQVLLRPLVLEGGAAAAEPRPAAAEAWPPPDPLFLTTLRLRV